MNVSLLKGGNKIIIYQIREMVKYQGERVELNYFRENLYSSIFNVVVRL